MQVSQHSTSEYNIVHMRHVRTKLVITSAISEKMNNDSVRNRDLKHGKHNINTMGYISEKVKTSLEPDTY